MGGKEEDNPNNYFHDDFLLQEMAVASQDVVGNSSPARGPPTSSPWEIEVVDRVTGSGQRAEERQLHKAAASTSPFVTTLPPSLSALAEEWRLKQSRSRGSSRRTWANQRWTNEVEKQRQSTIKKIAKQFIVGQLLFAKVPLKAPQTYEL